VSWPQRLLAVVFLTSGALHFLRPDVYEQIMPGYVPAHRELVLASGAAEIAGAVAVAFPRTRSGAGLWLAAVLVAVFPANVHMALHPQRYPALPAALLWARLPLQPLLVWWVLRATGGRAGRES
jgi:uncharacterized membrane protein